MNSNNLSRVILERSYKFQFEKMTLWEEELKLVINPKPEWCPGWLYQWAITLVLKQQHKTTPGKLMPPGAVR